MIGSRCSVALFFSLIVACTSSTANSGTGDAGNRPRSTDAGQITATDANLVPDFGCPIVDGGCPSGCVAFKAQKFDVTMQCLAHEFALVKCLSLAHDYDGGALGLGCYLRNGVPYRIIMPTLPGPGWTECPLTHELGPVHDTTTPECGTDISDGGHD